MTYLSEYKDIFGKPSQGVHSYRVFDIAIVDLLLTLLAAKFISNTGHIDFLSASILLLLLGVIFHWLFGVNTTLNKLLLS